ncbi:phage tail sheath subtilisin-like domain-containing protein [Youxingia wuxianensis]|uniref:Phage tail sheath subtilisin-like domain-containing protein n=1 Tax=Youxingia wuxianensis TaxID=2763678 RepID=A0A926IIP4_9FIRM|nr:phage tail sheath subtilisin-like domain-containing protein [Youxingia wuxianensis]MBC8586576.1 phage tail sheath subtilisin-like domain-containing protein [Youxingia wuxianensis]
MINRIIPGVSVETIAGEREASLGVVGVVTMPMELNWGDQVITIRKGMDTTTVLGYKLYDTALKLVNEVMNYANQLIIYRLNIGAKAQATLASGVTAKAVYTGTRGNDISVSVASADSKFTVTTYLDSVEMDKQVISDVSDFKTNDFIEITGSGTLETATATLTGGTNGTVAAANYDNYFTEIQKHDYNVMAYTGTDSSISAKIVNFIQSQRDNGTMVQAVMSGSDFDNEGIINNTIGGKTTNYDLTAAEACATMAGIQAKQGVTGSATYFNVIGWNDVSSRLTKLQMESKTQDGEILFVYKYGGVVVLYDINSLTTTTDAKPEDFKKNLVIRTLDKYSMDLQKLLDTKAIGKIRNSVDGRNQIKGLISDMTVKNYLNIGAIEDFTASDITVEMGSARDSIIATVGIKVVDTVDKIYITVTAL